MTTPVGPGGLAGTPALTPEQERTRLRTAAHQLEGVFLSYMFKAMRSTVPETESAGMGSEGRSLFTSMLDEKIADLAAARMTRGLGEALYRQLAKKLPAADR
jgi:flagellar protein FlgJ